MLALVGIVLVAGCEANEEPAEPSPEPDEGPAVVTAVEPASGAQRVGRKPTFAWVLPKRYSRPTVVTFLLARAGTGEEPIRDEEKQERIATATGLNETSPVGINPWEPPPACVLTGEITRMPQLAPLAWYRWSVRVVEGVEAETVDFYFRTREASAVIEE